MSGPSGSSASAGVQLQSSPSSLPSLLPAPPVLSTSFKGVLPPMHVRDYRKIKFEDLNKWKFYAYMPMCSFVVRCLSHPLTVIKTRTQTSVPTAPASASPYAAAPHGSSSTPRIIPYQPIPVDLSKKSITGALKHVLEYEGVRGLYSGFGVAVFSLCVGPIYLTSLEMTKAAVYNAGIGRTSTLPVDVAPLIAGAAASCVSQVVGVPLDVISNRQMNDPRRNRRKSAIAIASQVYRSQGIGGFYKGYWLTLMHNAPMSSLVWFTFGEIYPRLGRLVPHSVSHWSNVTPTTNNNQHAHPPSSSLPSNTSASTPFDPTSGPTGHQKWNLSELGVVFVSAAISGSCASMITLPLDVLKTRLQTSTHPDATLRSTWVDLLRERGVAGLMSGSRARLVASATTSAALMTLYEVLKRVCVIENEHEAHKHTHQ